MVVEDNECLHGLLIGTCTICRDGPTPHQRVEAKC